MLAYDNLATETSEKDKVEEFIKDSLNNLYWVKPVSNYYLIDDEENIRQSIYDKLSKYSLKHPDKLRFVLSPSLTGGVSAVVPKELIPSLKEITEQ